jgi:hypothetical protein
MLEHIAARIAVWNKGWEQERVSSALPSALARAAPINRRARQPPQIGRNFWPLKFYQRAIERKCNFGKQRKTMRCDDPFSSDNLSFFKLNSHRAKKQHCAILDVRSPTDILSRAGKRCLETRKSRMYFVGMDLDKVYKHADFQRVSINRWSVKKQ